MNKEAVQRLREPAAWVLVGAAAAHVLAGLVVLLFEEGKFSYRALSETVTGSLVSSIGLAALLVTAVFLAAWRDTPGKQARTVVIAALAVFGVALLFGALAWAAGLLAGGESVEIGGREITTGEVSGTSKLAAFLYGVAKLAVLGVGAWFTFTVFQSLQPARPVPPMQQGYPGYGYQQGGYQQPGVEGQAAAPPAQPQYDPQQYQQYQQPQQYDPQHYQQQGQPPQQGYQQGGYQQQGGQSLEEESAGEWTRAYGGGQDPAPGSQGSQGYGQQPGYGPPGQSPEAGGGEWYRDNRQ
ncbi:hypothetical protein [Thermomonospora amylolytica]|uniref:hypothetical protein n=1 Tax=Thermomonospora amylolytica TaxID=1411117 RepID=UPI000E6B663A|nr:hypothetical protein [Thermomonospora amylolytica]